MTQPQRKKRNGTAAIIEDTDYDSSAFYRSADFNDSLSMTDGLGSIKIKNNKDIDYNIFGC